MAPKFGWKAVEFDVQAGGDQSSVGTAHASAAPLQRSADTGRHGQDGGRAGGRRGQSADATQLALPRALPRAT